MAKHDHTRENLSVDRLREVLRYNPQNGEFRWRMATSNRVKIGDIAGSPDRNGHLLIRVDGVRYAAHRLAWLYVHGRWPAEEIDHINMEKDDNRIANLREASRAGNCRNVGMKRHNKLGVKGVHTRTGGKSFVAQITIDGRPRYLGTFPTSQEAHAAYVEASTKLHGKFGRYN